MGPRISALRPDIGRTGSDSDTSRQSCRIRSHARCTTRDADSVAMIWSTTTSWLGFAGKGSYWLTQAPKRRCLTRVQKRSVLPFLVVSLGTSHSPSGVNSRPRSSAGSRTRSLVARRRSVASVAISAWTAIPPG
jgi:hypothetical protein